MEVPKAKFDQVRQEAERFYKQIGKVRCPYLEQDVHFNREGFEHLLFKSWNRTRSQVEQYQRLRLIRFATEILKKSHTLQEYDERMLLVRQRVNSRWEKQMQLVRYFVFVAIVKQLRFKVVVKQVGEGPCFFYSLYPSWSFTVDQNGKKQKKLYREDPESL